MHEGGSGPAYGLRPPSAGYRIRVRRLGVDTYQEPVIYMHADCPVCRSEGFGPQARIEVRHGERWVIATLNVVTSDLLRPVEAGLSEAAWRRLGVGEGDEVALAHPRPVDSLSLMRQKVYGDELPPAAWRAIVADVAAGRYADVHLAALIAACAGERMTAEEVTGLTAAMIAAGARLEWGRTPVVDKHCVGGLPGNRTTPIVVAVATACGLTMPKTSSRAITSPAGTADTMETLAPVALDLPAMRRVVEREGGCIVWGGSVDLSPADDVLVRVERALDLDSDGQLVASVLSKKVAAGSTHVVLDLPVGATAKVRSPEAARSLGRLLAGTAQALGLITRVVETDGSQPVGRGIGPALEARDVLAVLQGRPEAPADLRERALLLAGHVLELAAAVPAGGGLGRARAALESGRAWAKLQAICEAQGGMREPPVAAHTLPVGAAGSGRVAAIDNRKLARAAKLAGAPRAPAAGLEIAVRLGDRVAAGAPLFTLHAETPGELGYAADYVAAHPEIVTLEAEP
jgi:thymidine phosphorylase